ncbi:TIM barrel protein [Paenibacillus lupini]|uniref:sugar phosphate isomerase/epimerase family protein n=1 Tax=Paenibacillus lupini TaxID=1450204 RepID=UPI001420CCFA|nr:TIM barrel protein [Paenibacillus lupini]NIK22143.1 sugar phosphate isomerase/epimerase [Paenibacillus lupini]
MAKPIIGLQLYTLRDLTEKDFLGTIRKAAQLGYKAVEFAGFYDTPAKDVRALLNELDLLAPSAHIGINYGDADVRSAELDRQIEYAQEIGLQYIVAPSAPLPNQPTMDDVKKLAAIFEEVGRKVSEAGLQFGYHNHDFEFKLVNNKPVMDHFLELVPAQYLVAEFDLGWIHTAGYTPVDYVKQYSGRVPLVHFKDFVEGHRDTEVGKGAVDLKSVLPIAEASGIKYIFVEQETFSSSSLESAAISLAFFHKNGF